MKKIKKEIGLIIKITRLRSEMKQNELARYLEVSPAFVSDFETGRRMVSMKYFIKLCNIFGESFGKEIVESVITKNSN